MVQFGIKEKEMKEKGTKKPRSCSELRGYQSTNQNNNMKKKQQSDNIFMP